MASSKGYLDYVLEQMSGLEDVDNRQFLTELFVAMYDELPAVKKRKG